MFTICFAVYASLVSVEPISEVCVKSTLAEVSRAVTECQSSKDPISTCEARRAGALKVFVTRRFMVGK